MYIYGMLIIHLSCSKYLSFFLQHQITAQDTTAQEPRRKITCAPISNNVNDYTPNYTGLINACLSVSFNEPPAVQRIRENNAKIFQTMNDMRRFQKYTNKVLSNSTLTAQQKTDALTKLNTAITKFSTDNKSVSDKYLTETNTLAAKLGVMDAMQQCQTLIQTATVSQVTTANTMMALPDKFCTEMKTAFAVMEKAFDDALTKIGTSISK